MLNVTSISLTTLLAECITDDQTHFILSTALKARLITLQEYQYAVSSFLQHDTRTLPLKYRMYRVELDGLMHEVHALSLAEIANMIRGLAKKSVRVDLNGTTLIDATPERGNQYDVLAK